MHAFSECQGLFRNQPCGKWYQRWEGRRWTREGKIHWNKELHRDYFAVLSRLLEGNWICPTLWAAIIRAFPSSDDQLWEGKDEKSITAPNCLCWIFLYVMGKRESLVRWQWIIMQQPAISTGEEWGKPSLEQFFIADSKALGLCRAQTDLHRGTYIHRLWISFRNRYHQCFLSVLCLRVRLSHNLLYCHALGSILTGIHAAKVLLHLLEGSVCKTKSAQSHFGAWPACTLIAMQVTCELRSETTFIHLIFGQGFSWTLHTGVHFKPQERVWLSCIGRQSSPGFPTAVSQLSVQSACFDAFPFCNLYACSTIWHLEFFMEEQSWRKIKFETRHKPAISTISQTSVQGSSEIDMCAELDCLQTGFSSWVGMVGLGWLLSRSSFAGRSSGTETPTAIQTARG